jgi:hypothetical protein
MTIWGIDLHGKDCLYKWQFCLKNILAKFQTIMDWVLASFSFAKCYIDDIIIFQLTPRNHMHHL